MKMINFIIISMILSANILILAANKKTKEYAPILWMDAQKTEAKGGQQKISRKKLLRYQESLNTTRRALGTRIEQHADRLVLLRSSLTELSKKIHAIPTPATNNNTLKTTTPSHEQKASTTSSDTPHNKPKTHSYLKKRTPQERLAQLRGHYAYFKQRLLPYDLEQRKHLTQQINDCQHRLEAFKHFGEHLTDQLNKTEQALAEQDKNLTPVPLQITQEKTSQSPTQTMASSFAFTISSLFPWNWESHPSPVV